MSSCMRLMLDRIFYLTVTLEPSQKDFKFFRGRVYLEFLLNFSVVNFNLSQFPVFSLVL